MVRLAGLDHEAGAAAAELFQYLEGAFIGPEILPGQDIVGGQDGHQAQGVVFESLGHVGAAHQDIGTDNGLGEILRQFRFDLPRLQAGARRSQEQHLLPGLKAFLHTGEQLQGEGAHHAVFPALGHGVDDEEFGLFSGMKALL